MKPPRGTKVPGRVWLYPKGQWDGPLVMRGGDEWGRWTLAFRLPGHRALVVAYRWCTTPPVRSARTGARPPASCTGGGSTGGPSASTATPPVGRPYTWTGRSL